jgi:hypothetical protein
VLAEVHTKHEHQLLLHVHWLRRLGVQVALLDVNNELMSHDFEAGILQILPLCLKSGLVAVKAGLASGEG